MNLGGHLGGGHLGDRVSALLDGQLSEDEAERAWQHVHTCHECRDRVEREGWVKRRLSCAPSAGASDSLKGALLSGLTPGESYLSDIHDARTRRTAAIAALGGGAVGAAVMGVLALGTAPASAPTIRPPAPVTAVNTVTPTVVVNRLHR